MQLQHALLWWPLFCLQLIQCALTPRKLSRTNRELRSHKEA